MRVLMIQSQARKTRARLVSEPLEKGGHSVELLDISATLRMASRLVALRRRDLRPEVIISVGVGPKVLLAYLLTRGMGISFVARLEGDPFRDGPEQAASAWADRQPRQWLEAVFRTLAARILLARGDDFIMLNSYLANRLANRMKSTARIAVVPQHCPGDPVPRSYRIERTPVLLTAANLSYRMKAQGVVWLIDRLAEYARETRRELVFRVAGDGQHLRDIRLHLEAAGVPPSLKVELLGFVEDMNGEYATADIFLYRSEHDISPNVLLEAKRSGVPVLVNDFPAFHPIVTHEVSGLFYNDAASFGRSLHRLLGDEALRQRLARAGQREHIEIFSIEPSGLHLEQALKGMVSPRSSLA